MNAPGSPVARVDLETELADERVQQLIQALFDPVCRDYAATADALEARRTSIAAHIVLGSLG